MADKYLHFTYAGIHSSTYNLFYVNEGEGLTYPFLPSFTQKTSAPLYQQYTYFMGTDYGQTTYSLNLATQKLTNTELRAIINWLKVDTPQYISFDAFPHYQHKVILTDISQITVFPKEWDNGLIENIATFNVTFMSVETPYPVSKDIYSITNSSSNSNPTRDTETRLPILERKSREENTITQEQTVVFSVNNFTALNQYLQIDFTNSPNFNIYLDGKSYYSISNTSTPTNTKIQTEFGYITDRSTNSLIEELVDSTNLLNNGPMKIPSNLVYHGTMKKVSSDANGVLQYKQDTGSTNIGKADFGTAFQNLLDTEQVQFNLYLFKKVNSTDNSLWSQVLPMKATYSSIMNKFTLVTPQVLPLDDYEMYLLKPSTLTIVAHLSGGVVLDLRLRNIL